MAKRISWNQLQYYLDKGYSEEEAKIRLNFAIRSASVLCKEYWIKRGYSEEEAAVEISKKQSKNSSHQIGKPKSEQTKASISASNLKRNHIDYWIEKYGEAGLEKFEENKEYHRQNGQKAIKIRMKDSVSFIASNPLCKEYWIKRGYSEEEAAVEISKKQSRSLAFFTEKYGVDDGAIRWNSRQTSWQKSMQKLDQNALNEKRRINAHGGYYTLENIKKQNVQYLFFYVLRFSFNDETFLKFGITKKDKIHKRWKSCLPYETLIFEKMSAESALTLENSIKRKYKQCLYFPKNIKTREALSINLLQEILDEHRYFEFSENID